MPEIWEREMSRIVQIGNALDLELRVQESFTLNMDPVWEVQARVERADSMREVFLKLERFENAVREGRQLKRCSMLIEFGEPIETFGAKVWTGQLGISVYSRMYDLATITLAHPATYEEWKSQQVETCAACNGRCELKNPLRPPIHHALMRGQVWKWGTQWEAV